MRLQSHIRLTRPEMSRWVRITGFEPVGIRTIQDFERYVGSCKQYYAGACEESQIMSWLIDEEAKRCLHGVP